MMGDFISTILARMKLRITNEHRGLGDALMTDPEKWPLRS
jgi:hypothetical protein